MDNFLILERLDRLEKLIIANKEVLTFEETCDYTGISRSYLYKLTASGNIPHSKPNGKMISSKRGNSMTGYFKTVGNPIPKSRERHYATLSKIEGDGIKKPER